MTASKFRSALARLSRWPFFLTYCAFLYFTFTLPLHRIPPAFLRANDKVVHFLDFFILCLLAFRTFFTSHRPFFQRQAGGKAILFSLLYGAFLEGAQLGIPGRKTSFSDWLADFLGILVGSGIFRISRLTPPV